MSAPRCGFCMAEPAPENLPWVGFWTPGFVSPVDDGGPVLLAHPCCALCRPLVEARAWPRVLDRLGATWTALTRARIHPRRQPDEGVDVLRPGWRSEMAGYFLALERHLGEAVAVEWRAGDG